MPELIPGSRYAMHPGFAMEDSSKRLIEDRTGRSFADWVVMAQGGPPEYKDRAEWLKSEHGLTTNYANWVAERSFGKGGPENYRPEEYVDDQYAGKKAHLRPIYNALLDLCLGFADDLTACPCETMVPIYRNHVIAQIKPTTNTRIDLGFALKDTPVEGRLIDTGGFAKKDRITHRIPITSLDEVGDDVRHWLARAYEMDR
jgi:hypothetical protein